MRRPATRKKPGQGAAPSRLDEGFHEAPVLLIVEDHQMLAQSLAFGLRHEGLSVDAFFSPSAEDIVAVARQRRPDLILLGLHLGEQLGSGLSLIEPLRQTGAQVIMLTGDTDRARLAECVEAGASGVVLKTQSFQHLIEAVKEAATMGSLLSDTQRDLLLRELRLAREEQKRRFEPFERLTARERQVLAALMDGLSAEAMAQAWVLSLATVRSQIHSVLTKLGVNSQLAAVARARQAGWTAEPEPMPTSASVH